MFLDSTLNVFIIKQFNFNFKSDTKMNHETEKCLGHLFYLIYFAGKVPKIQTIKIISMLDKTKKYHI